MQSHGFPVKTENVDNLGPIKERVGVPYGLGACHTAEVDGYFIEGHVPAADVQRLLAEKPKAKGLVVPGMPIGSPGMEQGDRVDPYEVLLVHEDGSTSVYAKYPQEATGRLATGLPEESIHIADKPGWPVGRSAAETVSAAVASAGWVRRQSMLGR